MSIDSPELLYKYIRRAFVNNSFGELSTHLALKKTWDNSFSYLAHTQHELVGNKEYSIDLIKSDENTKGLHRLYFDKSYKPCFDIGREMINICDENEYRKSKFYKTKISYIDIINHPELFKKIPIIIIDNHTIWDYNIFITDEYATVYLPMSSNFIFQYERNIENDKRIYNPHKLKILIVDNVYYQRINVKKPIIEYSNKSFIITDEMTKTYTIKSPTATTESATYKPFPIDDGIMFCSIHIPDKKKKNYETGTMLIELEKTDNGYRGTVTDDIAEILDNVDSAFYISIFFLKDLHKHIYYTGNDYATSVNGEVNIACILKDKETAKPFNMPIPIENCILLKKPTSSQGYEILHNVDNIDLYYPTFYHINDETQEDGDIYKLYYFYHHGYKLHYTCIHDFFFYFLSLKCDNLLSNLEENVDKLYRGEIILYPDSEDQEDFYDMLLHILTYYSYIHRYKDLDLIHNFNDHKVNIWNGKSVEYKSEVLIDFIKHEPFILRDYVMEQKKKGVSAYIFTNTIDLESRIREDTTEEFPDDINPIIFDEPCYVFSLLNNEEDDHHVNIRVFIDGLFVMKDLIQKRNEFAEYLYIPQSFITENSFIEIEYVNRFYFDKEIEFESLDDEKTITFASNDPNTIPTNADFVMYDDIDTGIIHRYDPSFFDIKVINNYGEFKTSNGSAEKRLRFVNLNKFKIKTNDEMLVGKPLKIRLSKSAEGIRYVVPRDGEVYLEFVDNTFGYHKDFIRVYVNGRIMPREKYVFYPMYHYPRIRFIYEMHKDDVIYIDVSPYRYTQIYYQEDISPTNELFDLRNIINKPFDIRYYDVYLNGRKLSLNNVITIDPWTIKFVNIKSSYNLLIFEKERDYEYYGVNYTEKQFFFSIDELIKKRYVTEEEKRKLLDFVIENNKEDDMIIGENTNDEEKEEYPGITDKYIYYIFDMFYYEELIPKTFVNPDITQFSLLVLLDWYTDIYNQYITSPTNATCSDEPNAYARRTAYIDALCLNPDLTFYGPEDGDDNAQLVYVVGHLNELTHEILGMDIEIATEKTIDKYVKDDLEKDELEVYT